MDHWAGTHNSPSLLVKPNFTMFTSKGMNTEDFKYNWGGEDTDLRERVLNAKLEVERTKHPGLYHHYHARQGLWN